MATDAVVRKIVALLASDAHERQIAAAIVLGEVGVAGGRDGAVVDGLIAAIAQGLAPVQRHAVEALGRLTARKALPVILGLLGARDEGVRAAAVAATVAFRDDAVAPLKQRLAVATDALERRGLEEALARVGGKDAFSALLTAIGATDVDAAKAAVLAARQHIKDAGTRERNGYLAQVTKVLAAKRATRTPAQTAGALKILGYLEDPSAAGTLLSFARDGREPEAVRQEALIALRFTAAGTGAARVATALVDLAEKAPPSLARTALYSLASIPIQPALARRLATLALRGAPEQAQLAIERLAQMPHAEAGTELATILAQTKDRARAEAASAALAARPEAARALGAALLGTKDDERVQLLSRLLLARVADLAADGSAGKKVGRALVQLALARAADTQAAAQSLFVLARRIDPQATAAGLRLAAAKLGSSGSSGNRGSGNGKQNGKHRPAGNDAALAVLRRLGHSAEASPADGYALGSAEWAAGRKDEALTIFVQLLDGGYDLAAALRSDRTCGPEQRYQIGFALIERHHPSGEEIMDALARDGGRGKVARMAKAKLRSAGVS
ncbi:MAG: HEAT repeat domain-containing protein [Pseudomonadota bacterium]